jgi:hypothetical protein
MRKALDAGTRTAERRTLNRCAGVIALRQERETAASRRARQLRLATEAEALRKRAAHDVRITHTWRKLRITPAPARGLA